LALSANGEIKPCCQFEGTLASRGGPVMPVAELMSSPKLEAVRREMLAGRPVEGCRSCYETEAQGAKSRRQMSDKYLPMVELERPRLRYLETAMENTCNLRCRSCSSFFSTKWLREDLVHGSNHILTAQHRFDYDSLKIDPSALRAVRLVGGEPLLFKDHDRLCAELEPYAEELHLEYNTNLTVLPKARVQELWKRVKSLVFTISIDGLGGLNDYLRKDSEWDEVLANLEWLENFCRTHRGDRFYIGVHTTVSVYNVNTIPELDRFFSTRFPRLDRTKFCVLHPPKLALRNLPESYKERVRPRLEAGGYRYILNSLNQAPNLDFMEFVRWNRKLDESRQERLEDVNPELGAALQQ
jgi:sulfatase maturation enzyme AslB (radical SAM superfamily)